MHASVWSCSRRLRRTGRAACWLDRRTGSRLSISRTSNATWKGSDAVVLPGGFSYGDYLRAERSLARAGVAEVIEFARGGGPVLGDLQWLCGS